jgi:hypothetical protein
VTVFKKPDPLLLGAKQSTSFYLPVALLKELKRSAAIDGVDADNKLSPYVAELLTASVRMRQLERAKEGSPE